MTAVAKWKHRMTSVFMGQNQADLNLANKAIAELEEALDEARKRDVDAVPHMCQAVVLLQQAEAKLAHSGVCYRDMEAAKLALGIERDELKDALARLDQFEDAVYAACFDHNSVDMSGKVRWARAIPVSSVMRHIFDAYGSEPLTPDGTVPSSRAERVAS